MDARSLARMLLVTLTVIVAVVALPASAVAADAETFTVESFTCNSGNGGGQLDASGMLYVACGTSIKRFRTDGTEAPAITIAASAFDVAPSPDGAILYVVDTNTKAVIRYDKVTGATYSKNTTWKLKNFAAGVTACNPTGSYAPLGRMIATDAWGDIYFSNGGWSTCAPSMIVKYSPTGDVITSFGGYGTALGEFNTNMGLAVSADGRTIYTVEHTNSRVQQFDYRADGSYGFTRTWGQKDDVYCSTGKFAAPYDIGLDPWGYVYVMDTSCERVQKFTENGLYLGQAGVAKRAHGIAVSVKGDAYVGQGNKVVRRTSAVPGPVPTPTPLPPLDTEAPVITAIEIPATTVGPTATVGITATDDGEVAFMRLANEDGAWGAWQPFATPTAHTLSAGDGTKGVFVQVRDAAGRDSNTMYRTTVKSTPAAPPPDPDPVGDPQPVVDVADPVVVSVAVPEIVGTRDITITVEATDDGTIAAARTANEDGNWGPWRPFTPELMHTLSTGYGNKAIFVQVRDTAAHESNVLLGRTRYAQDAPAPPPPGVNDVAAPTLESLTLPATTTAQAVDVVLAASDDVGVAQMRFANEDGNWGPWKAYAATTTQLLSDGYGAKGVFAQVRDAAGRESNVIYRTTKYQADAVGAGNDVADPILQNIALPATTNVRSIEIGITATDDRGVTGMRFANEDGSWGAWRAFSSPALHELSAGAGTKGVFVQVRDAAGRESNVLFALTRFG